MYKLNLQKPNGTKVTTYTNLCTYSDSASFKVIKYARMIADKPEGGSAIISYKKYLRVENVEELKDFKPRAMPGKTQYIVLILDCKTEAFEEITVSAGSTASAYAIALKKSVIKENIIAYVYDTTQKLCKGKANKEIKLDSELRDRIETFVTRCAYYHNCYFWTPKGNSSDRARQSSEYSIPNYYFAVNGDYYSMEFELDVHCTYIKATSYIKKNGNWTTLTTLKTLLRKDGCFATPEQQAS